jgi:plastocyanin
MVNIIVGKDVLMTKYSRTPFVPSIRLIAICTAVLLAVVVPPGALRAQWQWHAAVGAQSKDLGHQALAFLPNELWIHEGDTITWKFEVDEIHTVTFLKTAPTPQPRPPFPVGCPGFSSSPATFDGTTCVTTPPLVIGQQFSVTFPKKGNYELVCLVHPTMTGVVHVLDASTPLPFDQQDYTEQAADQRKDLLSDVDHGDHDGHDGHHGWKEEHLLGHGVVAGTGEITANGGGSQTLSIMRFSHDDIRIHVGDTVEWTNDDPVTPHTITFGTEPADPMPPSGNVTLDADGARHATIHSSADSAHSGFIVAAPQERTFLPQAPLGVTRFRVTFTSAGTYPYICALHDDLGMKGNIIVVP